MDKDKLAELLKALKEQQAIVAKARDEIRDIVDEFSSVADDCSDAVDNIEYAIDALSRLQ